MSDVRLTTPVGFVIFNRPETTRRVFEAIRQVRPSVLLVTADGPRRDVPSDLERCAAARAIVKEVDWPCDVHTRFLDHNMGCGRAVSSGVSWIFEQAEEAIILEDDCVPAPDFFPFCQEVLRRYRDDTRVMLVSGTNVLGEWKSDAQSYHYSMYGGIWGWASWRRAWRHFDLELKLWAKPEARERVCEAMGRDRFERRRAIYERIWKGDAFTWDYQWGFARLSQSGLAVVPSRNLISNIGCAAGATHTSSATVAREFGNRPVFALEFPLRGPACVAPDKAYDHEMFDKISATETSLAQRALGMVRRGLRLAR